MRLAGAFLVAGVACLAVAGFLVALELGFAVLGAGLLWLARLSA
jgi:hypothetical protein